MKTDQNNTQFAIVTTTYNIYNPGEFLSQANRLMHFKAAASCAAKIIEDPANYTFDVWGYPKWQRDFEGVSIYDNTKTEVASFSWGKSAYFDCIEGIAELYNATMYILAVMREARERVIAIGLQEMTPAEIEKEFGLSRGTVRKYIHDNREVLERTQVIRKADARTILCKRGWAICRWGNKK